MTVSPTANRKSTVPTFLPAGMALASSCSATKGVRYEVIRAIMLEDSLYLLHGLWTVMRCSTASKGLGQQLQRTIRGD